MTNFNKKNLYLLLTGNVLTHIGTGITMLAIPWILIKNLHATKAFGYMSIGGMLLGILLLPLVGMIIDFFSRKKILIYTTIFGCITTTGAVFYTKDSYGIFALVCIYILGNIVYNFQFPTILAFIQEVFPKNMYKKVNGLLIIQSQVAMMTAGGLAGILLEKIPLFYILILDASTYLIAFFLFSLLKYEAQLTTIKSNEKSSQKNSPWQGLKYITTFPQKCIFLLCALFPFIILSGFNYLIPIHIAHTLDSGAQVFGWVEIFWALGAIIAGIMIPKLLERFSIHKVANFCFIVFTIAIGAIALNTTVFLFITYVCIAGWAHSSVRVVRNTALMHIVDNREIGRVNTIMLAIGNALKVMIIITLTNLVDYAGTFYCFFILFLLLNAVFYLMMRNGHIAEIGTIQK